MTIVAVLILSLSISLPLRALAPLAATSRLVATPPTANLYQTVMFAWYASSGVQFDRLYPVDFGDGKKGSIAPNGTVAHVFAAFGPRTVAVLNFYRVAGERGVPLAQTQVTIKPPSLFGAVGLTASPRVADLGQVVTFAWRAEQSRRADVAYPIYFGDGTSSTIVPNGTVRHTYAAFGQRTVTVANFYREGNGPNPPVAQTTVTINPPR